MNESKIYVGNLSYNTSESGLKEFFTGFGNIESIKLITDRETGRSKGFAFITYFSSDECNEAIQQANGVELDGRKIIVNMARSKPQHGGHSRRQYV
ncbi:RNA-binding protein [Thiotrichales bacterium 19S11-10]|nr:RNA-binding protein [Thiotrichales bacterium 19S11-10]MCF6806912.1 RNA-binding protein [Thiotrichales bacterium 19S9-11]MCF6810881.1 RNA-binding protein [Thiotrichales bacterium 19S9-12]